MTIAAYVGLPGQGKTYGVVENVIKPALEKKREIWTNIPISSRECEARFQSIPKKFNIDDIIDDPGWWTQTFTAGSLIVIDEVWRLWPAGMKTNNVRAEDKEFLAEHRHFVGENGYSTEIYLITQDLSQLASFARVLIETTFRVTKLSVMGLHARYRVDVYHGSVTGSPSLAKRIREIQGKFKPKIFSLYQSHTKSLTGGAGNETRMDGRFNALGKISIKIGFVVFIVCAIIAYSGLKNLFSVYGSNDEEKIIVQEKNSDFSAEKSPILKKNIIPSREPVFKFLSRAESITIIFNNGFYPRIDYRYRILIDDSQTIFNNFDMASLGYEIYPINECAVKIRGLDFNGIAMCERDEKKQNTWVEKIVTNN